MFNRFLRKYRLLAALSLAAVLIFNQVSVVFAESALSAASTTSLSSSRQTEQKVALCVLGVCVNVPHISIPQTRTPNRNQPQPQPATSPQRPANVANEKPTTDLTGVWLTERLGSQCTINSCVLTPPPVPSLTVNGQTGIVSGEVAITQNGNQISIPDRVFKWDGGYYTYRYSNGVISGNKFTLDETAVDTSVGWGYTNSYAGTVSQDGNTITGEVTYKPHTGSNNTATTNFIWKKNVPLAQCPRFQTMLAEAKELQELADTLERDDKAYLNAVIDIILLGYSSQYAVYMLDVSSERIPDYFKDEQQIQAVRSQVISRIRTKASNREKFASIGINGQFLSETPIYSKENIELFCTLDSSKFTKEFWDSLWMAGYIDYEFYKNVENQLIVNYYQNYFDILVQILNFAPQARGFVYLYRFRGREYLFTKPELGFVEQIQSKELPEIVISNSSTIRLNELPPEALDTIEIINKGGSFPYTRDGIEFINREGLLPQKPPGYYREFTVKTPGASNRALRRIIIGENGEMYYTNDHYQKFFQIQP